jgi:hypothetical protein
MTCHTATNAPIPDLVYLAWGLGQMRGRLPSPLPLHVTCSHWHISKYKQGYCGVVGALLAGSPRGEGTPRLSPSHDSKRSRYCSGQQGHIAQGAIAAAAAVPRLCNIDHLIIKCVVTDDQDGSFYTSPMWCMKKNLKGAAPTPS